MVQALELKRVARGRAEGSEVVRCNICLPACLRVFLSRLLFEHLELLVE